MSKTTKNDLKKKIKLQDTFGTENLNPTSSVTKILNDISSKNTKAFSFYTKVLGTKDKSCARHCDIVGHTISCFPTDYDGSLPTDYFEEFSYRSNLPIFISPIKYIGIEDPLTEIIKIKKRWNDELGCLLKRPDALVKKYEKINEEVVKCSQRLIDAAMCLEREPEKNFSSGYNWFYAGHGNLHLLTINGSHYILHSELSCCHLTSFSRDSMRINYCSSIKYDCGSVNILETIYSDSNVVTLRMKSKIIILKIESSGEGLIFSKLKEITSSVPYTSVAFDGYHKNILYLTSLDDTLQIVNLDRMTMKTVQLCKSKSLLNNWSTVRYINRTEYVHVTRNVITIYDKRTHTKKTSWKNLHKYLDIQCDDITSVLVCGETPYIYVGTSHHLFCIDISQHSLRVLRRWTHCMQQPPTYITKCDFESDRELLCMSSQWCEDMCLIVSDSTKIETSVQPTAATLSYRPPSIRATLKEARSMSLCSDLYNPVDSRLFTGISGVSVTGVEDKYLVLMQNSLGDITCHMLYPKHKQHIMDNSSPEKLHEWCQNYKLEKDDLTVTANINIAQLWKQLKKIPDHYNFFGTNQRDNFCETEMLDLFQSGTVDPGLLEAWGIGLEDTHNDSLFVES